MMTLVCQRVPQKSPRFAIFKQVAVALVEIEEARVGDAGGPRGIEVAAVAAAHGEMALGQRERQLVSFRRAPRISRSFLSCRFTDAHERVPCRGGVARDTRRR